MHTAAQALSEPVVAVGASCLRLSLGVLLWPWAEPPFLRGLGGPAPQQRCRVIWVLFWVFQTVRVARGKIPRL